MDKAPASNSKLSLKVTHGTEIRRVSVERTLNFELLTATLRRLFKTLTDEEFSSLSIKYQDDEKDWISVSSNDELREAVTLLRTDVLRLSLVPQLPKATQPQGGCKRWQALRQQQQQQQGQKQPCYQNNSWQPRCFGGGRGRFYMLQAHALRLLENGDKTGNRSDIEAARALFHEQLTIFATHPTPLYNLACCEALLGNSNEALEFLQKSVTAGYGNVAHMESDSDLRSLRHLEGYKAIVASLKPKEAAKEPVKEPVKAVVVPEVKPAPAQPREIPVISVPAPSPAPVPVYIPVPSPSQVPAPLPAPAPVQSQENEAIKMLEGMGFVDRQRNLEVLSQTKGDVVVAIQLLLDSALAHSL